MSEYAEEVFIENVILEDKSLFTKDKYINHKTENGLYKCYKCNREFTLSSNLTRHMRHNKVCGFANGFECSNCHKVFSLNATMKDHYERCIAEDPYRFRCPMCPKQFTFKSSLNKHLRGRCRNLKRQAEQKSGEVFNCKYCLTEFYSIKILQHHESSGVCSFGTNTEHHTCPHCGARFTMKSSLSKHIKGRCKVLKAAENGINEENMKFVYENEISNSSVNDVQVYEAFFDNDDDNVIEECPEEYGEVIPNDVESYIEISNEATENSEKEYEFIIRDDGIINES